MNKTVRAIEWYSKEDDYIIDEEEIVNFDLEIFKKLFNHIYEDDPNMYIGGYNVLPEHVPILQQFIKHKIDLDKYIYQLGIYEDNTQ